VEYLDSRHSEWLGMWKELSCTPLNGGDSICLNVNHRWEYMGSTEDHHHFRHQRHPFSAKTEHIYIERRRAMTEWVKWPEVAFLAQHAV
jgi:hypothetical protein